MAVHLIEPRRWLAKPLLVAYVFWPVPALTPRWFDRAAKGPLFRLWCELRGRGLIRIRYYGRADG